MGGTGPRPVRARGRRASEEREYLALEAVAERRHELIRGEILGMACAEPEHNQIVQNLRLELSLALRDRACRITGADQRVKVPATTGWSPASVAADSGRGSGALASALHGLAVDASWRTLEQPPLPAYLQAAARAAGGRLAAWDVAGRPWRAWLERQSRGERIVLWVAGEATSEAEAAVLLGCRRALEHEGGYAVAEFEPAELITSFRETAPRETELVLEDRVGVRYRMEVPT